MRADVQLTHEFVDRIPERLEERKLYICLRYRALAHRCVCGCGNEVHTPLGPADWRMIYDGETVSLHPSVGNWGFKCRSHYWIQGDVAKWSTHWTQEQIDAGRASDRARQDAHYG